MKKNKSIEAAVYENRETLKKQDAWAESVSDKSALEKVVIEEHSYGNSERERLDFIYPKQHSEPLAVLVYIHGGGWVAGNKDCRRVYLANFAADGFFVINIEYDLAPELKYPHAIGQCVNAVNYALTFAEEYGFDTSRVSVGGESAGVYYAMFLAAIARDSSILAKIGLGSIKPLNCDFTCVLSNCGAVDFAQIATCKFPNSDIFVEAFTGYDIEDVLADKYTEELRNTSPLSYITSNYPPVMLMYGSWDELRHSTFQIKEYFDKIGVNYSLYKCTGFFYGQHTSTMITWGKKAFKVIDDILKFLWHNNQK